MKTAARRRIWQPDRGQQVAMVSSPAGAGRPEYRADPHRPDYAQAQGGRAGRAPAAPGGGRNRTPAGLQRGAQADGSPARPEASGAPYAAPEAAAPPRRGGR